MINHNDIRLFFKKVCFPLVLLVRAYRSYKHMQNWRNNVIGGRLHVRTTVPDGVFTIDARSALAQVAFTGRYEEHLMKQMPEHKIGDGLIVNIGANIGFYAVHLARVFPKYQVVAIEPNPEAFELLNINVEINGLSDRIRTIKACVSDTAGKVELAFVSGKAEYSSIGGIAHTAVQMKHKNTIQVDSFPLEKLLNGAMVSMIMMDVEGAELLVFKGSQSMLTTQHPVIVCECAEELLNKFGHSSQQLVQLLEEHGYRVFDEKNPKAKISFPFTGNIIATYNQTSERAKVTESFAPHSQID